MSVLEELREVQRLNGDTFSSYEVIVLIGRAVNEIERLQKELDIWRERAPNETSQ